ncbi:head GIN domain-containing protein [Sphingomonas sp. AX6]|uniref:head GIN domain-containing protein n=1 Tax=Sphingomonas sp. AX6 TaxID=2653171 RepID=UPI0012F0B959|nr:head GIN domain-containing protein [Sphingomonas sp. AX6]VXC67051.1 conserved hypothetical protein [Sphingomonas sp. AX6]
MRSLLIALSALPLIACNGDATVGSKSGTVIEAQGSGNARTYSARDFARIELRGADDIEVSTGGDFSVRAEGDAEILDKLEIRIDGDRLIVGRKDRSGWNWGSDDDGDVRILVSMPAIRSGTLAGSGDLTINRTQGDFDGELAGSGDMTVGILQGGRGAFSLAGSGTIAASGQIDRIDLSIAGSGNFDAPGLNAGAADINIAGSGDVRALVNGDASVSILGSGDVDLGANARCKVSKMGSGEVRCGNVS